MLSRIQLIRNIGQFDSANGGASIALPKLVVVYAENGRGKTTLSAILRSLGTGNPVPITERKRLSATHEPHVVIQSAAGMAVSFQSGAWTQTLPNLAVFDDVFVDENVFSGLSIEPGHRQNLHELIVGSHGVTLGKVFQAAERLLSAAREQDAVRTVNGFDPFELPGFDLGALTSLLASDLSDLDAEAATQVQAHLASLGSGGEGWIADGIRHVPESGMCPFCAQDLGDRRSLLITVPTSAQVTTV